MSALIAHLQKIQKAHGDIPVFRYYAKSETRTHPEIDSVELSNCYLENHRETPQMFGYDKVVELK
jgi:hypothetical protein